MGSGACEKEYQFGVVLLPYQQPVWFEMSLPATGVLRRKFVGTVFRGKLTVGFKQADSSLEPFHVVATLAAAFRVLAERLGHSYFVHDTQMPNDLNMSSEEANVSTRPALLSSCERR